MTEGDIAMVAFYFLGMIIGFILGVTCPFFRKWKYDLSAPDRRPRG